MKSKLIGLSIGIFLTSVLCLFTIYHLFFGHYMFAIKFCCVLFIIDFTLKDIIYKLKEMSKLLKINIDINIEKQAK